MDGMSHAWCVTLVTLNFIVAALNVSAYLKSGEARDFLGAVAWAASALYWLFRMTILP